MTNTWRGLPIVDHEVWDDGTVVTWVESPFPMERKPFVPSRLVEDAEVQEIEVEKLIGTQSRVTVQGVEKWLGGFGDNLPLVYRLADGRMYIADGHHRFVAAQLEGRTVVSSRVVEVPEQSTKKLKKRLLQ